MRLRAYLSATLGVAASASCTAGCSPLINNFTITPRVACPNETAVIHWDASGATQLTVATEPTSVGSSTCPMRGRTTSIYTLTARRGEKEQRATIEVVQLAEEGTEPIALPTTALAGQDVLAAGDKDIEMWNNRVTITSVAACDGRAIVVEHAGRVASLAPGGETSAAFAGMTLAGPWVLRSRLSSAEQNQPAIRPRSLAILATFRCQTGVP